MLKCSRIRGVQHEIGARSETQVGHPRHEHSLRSRHDQAQDRVQVKIPTNAELAAGLEGKLLLVHGDMDTNVHPAGTMRLVDGLIKPTSAST